MQYVGRLAVCISSGLKWDDKVKVEEIIDKISWKF